MRKPAGSIRQLHIRRDPQSLAPVAQVVCLVPSEREFVPRMRSSSVANIAHVAYDDEPCDHCVEVRELSRQGAAEQERVVGDRAADAGRSAPSAQDMEQQLAGQVLTLRIGKRSAWRLAAVGVAVVAAICILGAKSPMIFSLIGAIYLLVAWMHGAGYRIRVGIGGITRLTLWGTSRRLHWTDVKAVSFPKGEIVLHGPNRCQIRVPGTFDGHRAAIRLFRVRLPRQALNQSRIGLETHYLCQWDDCE